MRQNLPRHLRNALLAALLSAGVTACGGDRDTESDSSAERVGDSTAQADGEATDPEAATPGESLEVIRNLDHQVRQAGGVKVTESKLPQEAVEAWDAEQEYSQGRGDIYNAQVNTWLVRKPDRNIWLHFVGDTAAGAMMVIESAPFEATSTLLPASELKQQLDAAGKVALQVNFATDKAEILPDSRPQIDQVVALLKDDPALRLSVNGHTDNTGDATHNQQLSEARAAAVVAALEAGGIDGSRLQAKGFGQTEPVADNATEDGKARNRRVELVQL